jgi:GT2 family glycosyltransferase
VRDDVALARGPHGNLEGGEGRSKEEMRHVSVIILAYGDEPLLASSVRAALASHDVVTEVILVDNGCATVATLEADERLHLLTPGTNTGFAGGCNLAASEARYEDLVFVNSDLVVDDDAIARLVARLDDHRVGLATGAVLLPGEPATVNSIGNPIHYLMFSWAGDFGEPFSAHDHAEDVAGICGGFFACRRDLWRELGGFDEHYFAYAEDVDLSLRVRQRGATIVFEPRAVGVHHYEFKKNNTKWFLLERNRLMNFLTLYDTRSRWLLAPVLIPVEVAVLISAARAGWAREKLASWRWLWRHRRYLRERGERVGALKAERGATWTNALSGEMHIPGEFGLRVPAVANWVLGRYWRAVKSHVR